MEIEKIDSIEINDNNIVKFTEMGNITEIQYMSRKNNECMIKILDGNKYCYLPTGEIFDCNQGESRLSHNSSLYRSFRTLRNVINANIVDVKNVRWVTLTYAENMTDTKKLYIDFKKFNMRFQYYCKSKGYGKPEYITVVEPQERGAWHHHLLYIWDSKAPFIANNTLADLWGNGYVTIKELDNVDNVGAYLTAYLGDMEIKSAIDVNGISGLGEIKEVASPDGKSKFYVKGARLKLYPLNLNIYRTSRSIKRPIVSEIDYKSAKKKVSAATQTYTKTLKIFDKQTDFVNILHKEYYNSLRK